MTLIVALVYTYVMSSCHALSNVLQNAVNFDIHIHSFLLCIFFFINHNKINNYHYYHFYNQIYYQDYPGCITIIIAFYCRYIIIVYIYLL